MKDSILNSYSTEEFNEIVQSSFSLKDVARNLGYASYSGDLSNAIKKRIEKENIDFSHFKSKIGIKRTEENIFIENSTADQSTLRRWYLKQECISYKCSICGQLPYWNNKELTLILDHINGINNDDRLENLRWVCPNCNIQLDTTNGKNKKRSEKKKYFCIDCGKEVSSKQVKRCNSCEKNNRKQSKVTREELKVLIRTTPFTKIGEKFGVSDNAIRKWCISFNLPSRVKDIKAYSDIEWEKI